MGATMATGVDTGGRIGDAAGDVLDALTDQIAALDANGSIVAVNDAWRRFARENGGDPLTGYVGASYLAACEEAISRGGDGSAKAVLEGLRAMLLGTRQSFFAEYPCHSPTEERWFAVRATLCPRGGAARVVVTHQDITARRRAEEVLVLTEQKLRAVLEALPVGVWIMDRTGRIVTGNREGLRIWGGARYVPPEQFGVYKGWWLDTGEPIAAEDWAAARAMKGETSIDEEVEIECFDGTRKVILNSAIPLLDAKGGVNGAIIVNQDVTSRKKAETALRASEEKWRKLFAILPVGVSVIDEERRIIEMNAALEKVLQISRGDLAGGAYRKRRYVRPDGSLVAPEELPSSQAIREQKTVQDVEIGIVKEDGDVLWTSVSAAPLPLPDARAVVVSVDITPRKKVEQELQRVLRQEQLMARTDPLTGATNRRFFFELASRQLAIAQRSGRPLSMVVFDIDLFKEVNDTLGHHAGDQVIKEVARRAEGEHLRQIDVLARHGGDEFVVLLPDCDAPEAAVVAERIRSGIAGSPIETDAGPVTTTISAGVATLMPEGDSVERVIHRADQALYAAKAAGRNRSVLFGSS